MSRGGSGQKLQGEIMSTPITCPRCAASFPLPAAGAIACPACHAVIQLTVAPPTKTVAPPPYAAAKQAQSPMVAPPRKSSGLQIALVIFGVLGGGMLALTLLCGVGGFLVFRRAAAQADAQRASAANYASSPTTDYSSSYVPASDPYAPPAPTYTPDPAPYEQPAYVPPAPTYTDPAYTAPPVYTEPSYAPPVAVEPAYVPPPAPVYDNSARIAELQTAIAQAEAELQCIDGRITLGTVSTEAGDFAEGQSENIGQALLLRLLTKAAEVGKQEWEKERVVVQTRLDAYRAELQQLQSPPTF